MTGPAEAVPDPPAFAHASEAELARILDFYDVRWEYEPHTFPVLWTLDGTVIESFSPDFYLPDIDLYVELTTLKQSLVRKKNRKLRRLRELYPDIRIKLFYARDFRMLMLKFGRVALVDALSGASGHVMPDRVDEVPADDGPAVDTVPTHETPAADEMDAVQAVVDVPVAIEDTPAASTTPATRLTGRRRRRRRPGRTGDAISPPR
jgi:hypothetical protein